MFLPAELKRWTKALQFDSTVNASFSNYNGAAFNWHFRSKNHYAIFTVMNIIWTRHKCFCSASSLICCRLFIHEIMQSHVAEVLVVSAVLLLCSQCMAYRIGPLETTCERFHVSHGSRARNINANVTILLRKMDGTEVSCIQTSENYRGAYTYELFALGWVW